MRSVRLALPVVAIVAGAMLTPAHAITWSCMYYKWDATHQRWVRVETLQEASLYESTHQKGVDWDCKYCVVPAVAAGPTGGGSVYDVVENTAARAAEELSPATETVRPVVDPVVATASGLVTTLVPADVYGPKCPLVPPEEVPQEMILVDG